MLWLKSSENNDTWSLLEGKHYIGCRLVFKLKYNVNGLVDRYKARLVAKGYTQQLGLCEEVYMNIPQGYKTTIKRLVCKLNKSMNLGKSQWFCKFSSILLQHGFT